MAPYRGFEGNDICWRNLSSHVSRLLNTSRSVYGRNSTANQLRGLFPPTLMPSHLLYSRHMAASQNFLVANSYMVSLAVPIVDVVVVHLPSWMQPFITWWLYSIWLHTLGFKVFLYPEASATLFRGF